MSATLFKKFDEIIQLSSEEKELALGFFTSRRLRKRQFLLQEGDVCKNIAFVEKGLLRLYKVDDKGHEHITQFAFEGWWISDQYSFLTGEPSEYNIEALENAELLLLAKEKEEQMLDRIPKLERFFRILLQNNLVSTQKRLAGSLSLSAEERYKEMMRSCPESFPHQVPQHMLASYLGITPETLSRIRKQVSQKSKKTATGKKVQQ